jgi:phosphoglycolate phosphatase-like HAD superfamily hydrolase
LFPGIGKALEGTYDIGVKIAILTDGSAKRATGPLKRDGVIHLVHDIVSTADMRFQRKPSADGMSFLAARHNIKRTNIIYFGDSERDILMANIFGCQSIGIGYGGFESAESVASQHPTAMIYDVAEIPNIPNMIRQIIKDGR